MKAIFLKLMMALTKWLDPKLEKWREPKVKMPVKPWTPMNQAELAAVLKRTPKHVMGTRERQAFSAAMSFETVRVEELMLPKAAIRMIKTSEVLGPILLDELYRSGFGQFPVIDETRKIVGWVSTQELNSLEMKESRKAEELMRPELYYVRNDYSLPQTIAAFNRTRAPFLLVIDRREQLLGLIVMEAIIEFLTFRECRDEFGADDNPGIVAKRQG